MVTVKSYYAISSLLPPTRPCPRCGELLAAVNPRNNLAHCFACHRNLNNIDLLRALGHDFLSAVELLERLSNQYQAQRPK